MLPKVKKRLQLLTLIEKCDDIATMKKAIMTYLREQEGVEDDNESGQPKQLTAADLLKQPSNPGTSTQAKRKGKQIPGKMVAKNLDPAASQLKAPAFTYKSVGERHRCLSAGGEIAVGSQRISDGLPDRQVDNWGHHMETAEASADDDTEDPFIDVLDKKTKKRKLQSSSPVSGQPKPAAQQRAAGSNQQRKASGNSTAQKIKPLVLEGLTAAEADNPMRQRDLLKNTNADISRTLRTQSGKVLVFAKTDADRNKLLTCTLREGASLREAAARNPRVNNFIVIRGVTPTLSDEELSKELQRPCKRLIATSRGGAPTWKVKVECEDVVEKKTVLQAGVYIGHVHYKSADYIMKPQPLQCFKCLAFQHVAANCDKEQKCAKCSGAHSRKDCTSSDLQCTNCGGKHGASSYECPRYAEEQRRKEFTTMSYANAVKKGGDVTDCMRLACSLASTLCATLVPRVQGVTRSDICKDVALNVSKFFRTNLNGEHVYKMSFPTLPQNTRTVSQSSSHDV
jgi:hypothetical protein